MPSYYKIRLAGHLDRSWSDWLGELDISQLESGETILTGWLADQATLFGVLNKIRDLNLLLLSVEKQEETQ